MVTRRAVARFFCGRVSVSPDPKFRVRRAFVLQRGERMAGRVGLGSGSGVFLSFDGLCELKMGHAGGWPSHWHESRCRAVVCCF
jgi:hypothetical protein